MLKSVTGPALAALAALALGATDRAAAQQGQPYATHGDWKVESFSPDPARGNFPYCVAWKSFGTENAVRFLFGWPQGGNKGLLAIEFVGDRSGTLGDRFPVKYWIDERAFFNPQNKQQEDIALSANAQIIDGFFARIEEHQDGTGSEDALANGKALFITSGRLQWQYPLAGSNAAFKSLFECGRQFLAQAQPQRHARPPAPQPPMRTAPPPPPPPAAHPAARQADCLMTIDGRNYVDGRCQLETDRDGSFQIFGEMHFAYVTVFNNGTAGVSWNSDPPRQHAQELIGEDFRRNGPCWENRRASICTWPLGQRPPPQRPVAQAAPPPAPRFALPPLAPQFAPPPRPRAQAAPPLSFQQNAPLPQRLGRNCPAPGSIRSARSNRRVVIDFTNNAGRRINLYWLDFNGQYKLYRTLVPGERYRQSTYMGHPWIAADRRGACWPVYYPKTSQNSHVFNP